MCDKVRFMKRRFLAVAAISIPLMMLTEASTAFADQARPSAQFVLPNEVVSLANRYGVLGSGKGNNHLDEGTGNIYRFDLAGAEEHIKWLGGTANYSPDGRPFGVATATKHSTIFLVEYFLN